MLGHQGASCGVNTYLKIKSQIAFSLLFNNSTRLQKSAKCFFIQINSTYRILDNLNNNSLLTVSRKVTWPVLKPASGWMEKQKAAFPSHWGIQSVLKRLMTKGNRSRRFFFRTSLLPAPFSSPPPPLLFVTGWGSSPLLAQPSSNGSCMFCWDPSSRTSGAWRCPPHRGPWLPEEPAPSGCPPSLARPLWRTWRALWPCWKT